MGLNLDELKATQRILNEVIEKQEQEEIQEKGYIILPKEEIKPTRESLKLLTIKEVSKEYGIGENRIRELTKATRENSLNFPMIKTGTRTYIPRGLFEEWLIKAAQEGLSL